MTQRPEPPSGGTTEQPAVAAGPSPRRPSIGSRFLEFAGLLMRRLGEDKAMLNASALTYTTLLALVPLMTVSVAVFAAFPVGDRLVEQLQQFVFENFVPAAGEVVQSYLNEFTAKAARLTGPSFAFLIVTSLLMMASIDRAFNDIWRVQRQRRALTKFLVYWAVITVGPLLMGLSVAVTSYVLSLPLLTDAADTFGGVSRLLHWAPLVASTMALTLLYLLVPLRQVPVRHALIGGLTAAVLFEFAKSAFAAYLARFPTYQAIYGALAAIPIFLIWIFLSWLITLFGAELTYCLGACRFRQGQRARPVLRLVEAFALIETLWCAQREGRGLDLDRLAGDAGVAVEAAETLLEEFSRERWVVVTDTGEWMVSRDLGSLRLSDLYNVAAMALPRRGELTVRDRGASGRLLERLEVADEELAGVMDVPLTDLFAIQHEGR